jgi:hypothetical protein
MHMYDHNIDFYVGKWLSYLESYYKGIIAF